MLFDLRQHGLWYWIFKGQYNEIWYYSNDNGAHVERLDEPFHSQAAQIAGLQYPGQLCFPWRQRGYGDAHGYRSSEFNGANDTIIDWVDSLLPGRPDTAQWFGFYAPEVHPRNPDYLLLNVDEHWKDTSGTARDFQSWFYSTNAGATWRDIWADTLHVWVTLDKRNPGTVWMTATPGRWGQGYSVTYEIFRKDLLATDRVEYQVPADPATAPVVVWHEGRIAVLRNTEYASLTIVDILGRVQLQLPRLAQTLESQSFAASLQPAISRYFAVLRANDGKMVVVPVQLEY